ncbi:pPIWI_RE module domain-containing protein [Amycolatopsis sp. PS_44_ISF1]|uniref:pPIWI_RE module domain-containing protein n=1 Tax=Amycolatopsis sp. PS_44_ISF1 TaxID=2974917 RepID=UPI0028E07EF0|nr:DUF3962 domain-containing protein [Amycolatopsis sp. PS_44_ISF1]MDT8916079.1 DUF3962 domain-containing protein [Amycolatopsis sp. PS_44_ISF1]
MAYNNIQTAAFVHNPDSGPLHTTLSTLAFPAAWRTPILDLYRHGRSEAAQAKIKSVPISNLNTVMRAVAPDLMTVDASASFDESKPWLYADAPYPQPVMGSLINAWLRALRPSPEAYPLFRDTVRALDTHALQWKTTDIDLLEQTLSDGGTAIPANRLFRLVPEMLAARIEQFQPYEHGGQALSFRRVAVDTRAQGAELMSWPPLEHHVRAKGGGTRVWFYSAVIRLNLRTVPFSPTPRIHISTSIRRWVSGPVSMPARAGVATYLLAKNSLVAGGASPGRFAVAHLEWDHKTGKIGWKRGGPEGILSTISAVENLPAADVFAKEPERWIHGRDDLTAAVAFHTRMRWHGVNAGLMPSERRRLTEWAAQALAPDFVALQPLQRSGIKKQNPRRTLEANASVPKEATELKLAEVAAHNVGITGRNADKRRTLTAAAVGESGLTAVMLYQTDAMRTHLINAIETNLGLSTHRTHAGPEHWSWQSPELTLTLHTQPLGALGAPLGTDDKAPRRGEQHDTAINDRRTAVAAMLAELREARADRPQLAFVELEGLDVFTKRTTDPKFAIRLGCVDAGMVSQFVRPRDPEATDDEDDSAFRAAAAWSDGLRQVGMRFVPEHSLGQAIPDQLNQLAFWMVKRRADGLNRRPQFTPVAVLIRPGQNCIMGRTADMDEWVPYPDLLKDLTGRVRPHELASEADQTAAVAVFIKKTLSTMRSVPTLLVVHAQNTRNRWPWLQNNGLVADRIQIGSGPLQRLGLLGKRLRIVRVAEGERAETPQWWAPKPGGKGGLSKGLWAPQAAEGEIGRVFYSTSEKASTHPIAVDASKLSPHITDAGVPVIKANKNAWNPDLLEYTVAGLQDGDEAEIWAMYLHQQRLPDDYRDDLKLPLILHLAELTLQYALPYDDADQLDDAVEDDADTAVSSPRVQVS